MDLDQKGNLSKAGEQKEGDEKFHVQVTECGNNTVNKYGCWRPIDGTLFKLGYKFNTTGQLCDRVSNKDSF
ncbi:unnamed protein product [Anisakis simplex]|uniref:Kunitz/Bovine pancreatic trypsin inhibitor domain protein n=1 Tax=Anisakis simplex TaxID=6269 RepID=A0A0M3JHT2_ANISI|nr:unnamed protein product [Anisakis simplex]